MAVEQRQRATLHHPVGETHRLLIPGVTRRESLMEYRAQGGYAPEGWAWSPEELGTSSPRAGFAVGVVQPSRPGGNGTGWRRSLHRAWCW